MKLEHHIAISTLVSAVLFLIFKSWSLSASSFLTGVFIDVDHIIDYFSEHGFRFRLREVFHFFYNEKHQKITLIFHAWEWMIILCALMAMTQFNPLTTGLFIGYGHHMVLDYFYSKTKFLTYSLMWRWKMNFDSEILFPRNRGYNPNKLSQ